MADSMKPLTDYFFGWDLLFETSQASIKTKTDFFITLVHFVLTRHYKFRSIGIGEDHTLSLSDTAAETLPSNWNMDAKKYALRYLRDKKLVILLGYVLPAGLQLNLLDVASKEVSNFRIRPDQLIAKTKGGPLKEILPSALQFCRRMEHFLIKPVVGNNPKTEATQTPMDRNRFEYRHPVSLFPIRSFSDFGTDPDNDSPTTDVSSNGSLYPSAPASSITS